ncbi:unnamed protein product [Musa acuminata subsp. burmannicoides]
MPSLSDQPLIHHLQQFEFKTLTEVPDSHAWPVVNDHPHGDDAVPVIDLACPDAARLIGQACEEWGAFQITGHGVPVNLLDRLEAQTRRLFSLPTGQKLKAARSPGGVTGYGIANISAFFSKLFWSEGFTIVGSPHDEARKLWPDDSAEFCGAIEEYTSWMKPLGCRLMLLMLASLGLSEGEIDWAVPSSETTHEAPAPVIQLNSYPACPDPDRAMGLAEHTDSSLFTVLYQGSVRGLQLLHGNHPTRRARWVTVPPLPGALVVNVGDLSHILSNGRFQSVTHRAIVNRTQTRISVAYFYGPPAHFKISPIEKLMGPQQGPVYRAVTWPEYLTLKRRLYNQALASIRLPSEGEEESRTNTSEIITAAYTRRHGEAKV